MVWRYKSGEFPLPHVIFDANREVSNYLQERLLYNSIYIKSRKEGPAEHFIISHFARIKGKDVQVGINLIRF